MPSNNLFTVDEALELKWSALKRAGVDPAPLEERCIQSIIVTRVFLTRQINYTFLDARIGALAQARAGGGADGAVPPDVPSVNVTINNNGELDPTAVEKNLDVLAKNVATSIKETGRSSGVTFEGFTALGAKFKQVFQRPVVIGWEGWPVLVGRNNHPDGDSSDGADSPKLTKRNTAVNQTARKEIERCEVSLAIH